MSSGTRGLRSGSNPRWPSLEPSSLDNSSERPDNRPKLAYWSDLPPAAEQREADKRGHRHAQHAEPHKPAKQLSPACQQIRLSAQDVLTAHGFQGHVARTS